MNLKGLACHAITWSNYKLVDTIEDIANLGFDGIELPSEFFLSAESSWSEINQTFDRCNIKIISVYQTVRLGNKDKVVLQYELKRCESLIELIHTLGIEYLIIGDPPTNYNDDPIILAESLEKLGTIAKSKRVSLCYHPHKGSIIVTSGQINKLLKLTSPEKVSLCLDMGHLYWSDLDPVKILRKYKKRVGYIHLKDLRKRPLNNFEKLIEIIKSFSIKTATKTKLRYIGSILLNTKGPVITELGQGDIDYFGVIKEINELNYNGWITIELDAPTLIPKLSLGRCLSHVNELLRSVE